MATYNQQNESNLHNFDTAIAEVIYHGILVLVILGFWLALGTDREMRPGTGVLIATILAASLNLELFNNVVTQFSILLALAIAAFAGLGAHAAGRRRDVSLLWLA